MVKKSGLKKEHKKLIPIIAGAVILLVLIILFFVQLFGNKVETGDTVSVDYTGYYDNGTVFDTNIESVALQSGIEKEFYQSFPFTLGQGQVIPGFEENVVGMSVGEKKMFTVPFDKGYGSVREEFMVSGLRRNVDVVRYSIVSLELYANLFGETPEVGKVLSRADIPWELKVVDVNETSVNIENVLALGQVVSMSGTEWDSVVTAVTNDTITLRQNPEVGDRLTFPTETGVIAAVVSGVSDDTFDVNANHPLAGMNLTFEVEVKNITKPN